MHPCDTLYCVPSQDPRPPEGTCCSSLDCTFVFVRVFTAATKHYGPKQVEEERPYLAFRPGVPVPCWKLKQELKRQESGGRSWCRGHVGALLTGLFLVTFLYSQDCQHEGGTARGGVRKPCYVTKKMPRLDYNLIFGGSFLIEDPSPEMTLPVSS